ncbi:ADP-sugar pyrophosphatase-like isoform X2 [Oratosquilla oratoria]|uniref:ADP-sugar pyrophosphatase-like isoform X2 n=1 Tax=Oratosquilla oratoria TaxID=337810 RepID=UPI003F76AF07
MIRTSLHPSRIILWHTLARFQATSSGVPTMTTNQSCRVDSVEEIASGKWLSLSNYLWTDHAGKNRKWEVVGRTTKGSNTQDCVAVIAKLKRAGESDSLVLVKQFRPPLKSYTIELPAGLIDPGETVEATALRELKEETSLTGRVTGIGREVALDPGISSVTMKLVTVEINGDASENRGMKKVCGVAGEQTEVLIVPLPQLEEHLKGKISTLQVLCLTFNDWRCLSCLNHVMMTR